MCGQLRETSEVESSNWNVSTSHFIVWPRIFVISPLCCFDLWENVHPGTGHEGPEGEYRYSSTLSMTLALDRGGCSTARPCRFTLRNETRCPLHRILVGHQNRSGWVRKISRTGIRSRDLSTLSELPYRLRYTGQLLVFEWFLKT